MSFRMPRHAKTPLTATSSHKNVQFTEQSPQMLGQSGVGAGNGPDVQFSSYAQQFFGDSQNPLAEVLAKYSQPPPAWQEDCIRGANVCLSFKDMADIVRQRPQHAHDGAVNDKSDFADAFAQDLDETRHQAQKGATQGSGKQNAQSPPSLKAPSSLTEELSSQRYGDTFDYVAAGGFSSFFYETDADNTMRSVHYDERCVVALNSRDYEVQHRYGDWDCSFASQNVHIMPNGQKIVLGDLKQLEEYLEAHRAKLKQFSDRKTAAERQLRYDEEMMYKQLEIAEMAEVVACAQKIRRCKAAHNLKKCIAGILTQQ